MSEYRWENKIACVATYRILEGDKFLDQFEDSQIPFEEAGDLKLGDLRYYPKTTKNPTIIEILGIEMSRSFLKYLTRTYTVEKENPQNASSEIISGLAGIFSDADLTVKDLAEFADSKIKFPGEKGA